MKAPLAWARNPLVIAYHDKEWGVPVRNDRKLFEFLILEGRRPAFVGHHPREARELPARLSRVNADRMPLWRQQIASGSAASIPRTRGSVRHSFLTAKHARLVMAARLPRLARC